MSVFETALSILAIMGSDLRSFDLSAKNTSPMFPVEPNDFHHVSSLYDSLSSLDKKVLDSVVLDSDKHFRDMTGKGRNKKKKPQKNQKAARRKNRK